MCKHLITSKKTKKLYINYNHSGQEFTAEFYYIFKEDLQAKLLILFHNKYIDTLLSSFHKTGFNVIQKSNKSKQKRK